MKEIEFKIKGLMMDPLTNAPIVVFFQAEREPASVIFLRVGERPTVALPAGYLERLGDGLPDQCIEPLLLTLEPGGGSGDDAITHLGHEFVLCLSGQLEYVIEGETYLMEAGDSLLFEAYLPHCWRNPSPDLTTALLLLHAPQSHARPLQRHFRRASTI